ncbi:hypothetical protein, partial [Desulfoscipio geothermicus]
RGVYTSALEKAVSMHGHPYIEQMFDIRLPYNTKTIKRCISTKIVLENWLNVIVRPLGLINYFILAAIIFLSVIP